MDITSVLVINVSLVKNPTMKHSISIQDKILIKIVAGNKKLWNHFTEAQLFATVISSVKLLSTVSLNLQI